jgi:hypothetical protein
VEKRTFRLGLNFVRLSHGVIQNCSSFVIVRFWGSLSTLILRQRYPFLEHIYIYMRELYALKTMLVQYIEIIFFYPNSITRKIIFLEHALFT